MKQISWLISKYLVQAILPYFVFAWLILSVILFVQQAGRFSDIFFSVNIPANLVWQLTIALIPNVIAFTCPMAMLVGTIIGLSKMQGDSELVAIRAAGVGNLQIAVPIIVLGVLLSGFAFLVNLRGVPLAAALVRSVALQTAIRKLESPIEPGIFNTEVAGYTIFVKGGDVMTGRWKNIFIYQQVPGAADMRLITSGEGRIDVSGQSSELVLENATVTTIPADKVAGKFASENIGEVRLAIKTKRAELIQRLSGNESSPEELGLSDLSTYAKGKEGKDRIEAELLWQRRIILSISPLIFCLLGTAMVLRFNRSGRGFGIFLSLVGLIGYYLLAFLGEQLARTGRISVLVSGLLPIAGSVAAITWLSLSRRIEFLSGWGEYLAGMWKRIHEPKEKLQSRNLFVDLTTGLGDFDLITGLLRFFLLTVVFLLAISAIFTGFELWRFAGAIDGGVWLLTKYLLYLVPFLYLFFAPSAAMIGTLATYVIKSRQNEIVTWISAGKSVYRLLVPCFVLMVILGVVNFAVQERIAPHSNVIQDGLRNQIRKGGIAPNQSGKLWVATNKRIYSFELDPLTAFGPRTNASQAANNGYDSASDNEKPNVHNLRQGGVADSDDSQFAAKGLSATSRFVIDVPVTGSVVELSDARSSSSGNRRNFDAGSVAEKGGGEIKLFASDNVTSESVSNAVVNSVPPPGAFAAFYKIGTPAFTFLFASDNEKDGTPCGIASSCVRNITVFEFEGDYQKLQTVYQAKSGRYTNGSVVLTGTVDQMDLRSGGIVRGTTDSASLVESGNPFLETLTKPSHMTISDIRNRIDSSESEIERRSFSVALQKRYVTLFLPLVIGLFTAPFSLSLGRMGRVVTLGYAVGLWLVYTGLTNVFEQLGMSGFLTPSMAVWSPVAIFSMLGIYLLSKVRT